MARTGRQVLSIKAALRHEGRLTVNKKGSRIGRLLSLLRGDFQVRSTRINGPTDGNQRPVALDVEVDVVIERHTANSLHSGSSGECRRKVYQDQGECEGVTTSTLNAHLP